MRPKRILLIALAALVAGGALLLYEALWAPNEFDGDRDIIVSKGDSYQHVVTSMVGAGIIRNRLLFDLAGRILALTTKMQIGKYRFTGGMSNKEILEDIRYGKTVQLIAVTIPEGLRATRLARIFSRQLGTDSTRFMQLVHDTVFARSLRVGQNSLEGYLLPNTYNFYWQVDEEAIIGAMVRNFREFFNDSLQAVAVRDGRSVNEVLTLASIVEKETSVDSERAVIAGVYVNRLEKRMKLEADPTVQYLLDDGPRRLHFTDLARESEYNTYLHYGLPPGPINNPGKASILAALNPFKSKYLFFVATGVGGHTFSRTFEQHKKAIRLLQKRRAEQEALKEQG